jgi:tRNA (uracil-5-)-methyltransferase TRM9
MVPWVIKGKPSNAMQGSGKEGQKKVVSHRHRRKQSPRNEGRRTEEYSRLDVEKMYSGVPSPTKISKQGPSIKEIRELETPGEGNSLDSEEKDVETTRTFQRYYHLYRSGELERDVIEAGGRVVDSGYERDNWWAIAIRG